MSTTQSKANKTQPPKPPISKWALVSAGCTVLSPVCFVIALILSSFISTTSIDLISTLNYFFGISSITCIITSCVIGLIAFYWIEKSNKPMRGQWHASAGFLIIGFLYFLEFGGYMGPGQPPYHRRGIMCSTSLKGLGNALLIHMENFGSFPKDDWCDRLIEYADMSPMSFNCPVADDIEGECSYALNKYLLGKEDNCPSNVILAFETTLGTESSIRTHTISERNSFKKYDLMQDIFKGDEQVHLDRWNQVGGPEDLNAMAHSHRGGRQGCNILFVDGSVEWCTIDELEKLKWDPADDNIRWHTGMLPEDLKPNTVALALRRFLLTLGGIVGAVALVGWLLIPGLRFKGYTLLITILASLTGAYWAWETEKYYRYYTTYRAVPVGWLVGLIWGTLAGALFCMIISRFYRRGQLVFDPSGRQRVRFDLLWAIAAGLFCPMAVHITLNLHHQSGAWGGMFHGIYFGIFAGVVTGFVSRFIFIAMFPQKTTPLPPAAETKTGEPE